MTKWKGRDIVRAGAAIIGSILGWGLIRPLFPGLDYYPPEILTRDLERSWFVAAGLRKFAMMSYATVALVVMAMLFRVVQQRWPGRGDLKGLAFGASFGVVWSFGFLGGWAFLGTTLRAELLNGLVDLIPLAVSGWLIGAAIGRNVPRSEQKTPMPWLATLMVAALIDRLLHHCHLVNIRGNSYRMREHTELYRALQPEVEPADTVRRSRRSKAAGH